MSNVLIPSKEIHQTRPLPLGYLLLKVEEVVGLVDEEQLEGGAAQVVAPEVDLSQL